MSKRKNKTTKDEEAQEEKAQGEETQEAKPVRSSFSPGTFDSFMDRMSSKASDGGRPKSIRRRVATVTIDHRLCEPGLLVEDFRLEIQALDGETELAALGNTSSGEAASFAMAKSSIRKFNGRALQKHEVDVLWEALAFGGRTVVTNVFVMHCTGADETILGNSVRQVEIG